MAQPSSRSPLPSAVREALERGHVVEAIKLLRESANIGLKEARERVEQERRRPAAARPPPAPPAGPAPPGMQPALPPEIGQAVAAGRKMEAIRLYRAHMGGGLKEAHDAVEKLQRAHAQANPMLAPGQVPPGNEKIWLAVLAVLLLVAAWFLLR